MHFGREPFQWEVSNLSPAFASLAESQVGMTVVGSSPSTDSFSDLATNAELLLLSETTVAQDDGLSRCVGTRSYWRGSRL